MRKRIIYGSALLVLALLVTMLVWQGSFSFGDFGPTNAQQTYLVWAVSTLNFLLTVVLAFMLARNFVKLYVDRHSNREGSRIRTKLVAGALILSFMPVMFLLLFSIGVLNVNLNKWFSNPAENVNANYIEIGNAISRETHSRVRAWAEMLSTRPEREAESLTTFCKERNIEQAVWIAPGGKPVLLCSFAPPAEGAGDLAEGQFTTPEGTWLVRARMSLDLAQIQKSITSSVNRFHELARDRKAMRRSYLLLLTLITLFVLFVATWIALFLAKQISVPIAALYAAAQEVRNGNLSYRLRIGANDELASLVRAFNEMTQDLEANSRELENRRRFTEAILESIPTGVISLSSDGRVQRVNRALKAIFSVQKVESAARLDDLFPREDAAEIRYLMNRARRMGIAATQLEFKDESKVQHLSVTVAALEEKITSGFVIVIEDTSDLLRAQKAAAWHEVARRIAHEIKNPLTPIGLCAERIGRHLERWNSPESGRVIRECSATISSEVETLRTLVDEFSQFARFPAAQPVPSDLNEVVENAVGVFRGRLEGIEVRKSLQPDLPMVNLDREQFKRLIVNLIDNAAEAMQDSLVKGLSVSTCAHGQDSVELVIADTGIGISAEDKEKLFLPYFSTKGRGTGLGLAIVNHIVSDHNATIRVEDNIPTGARFIVEIATTTHAEVESSIVGSRA